MSTKDKSKLTIMTVKMFISTINLKGNIYEVGVGEHQSLKTQLPTRDIYISI